MNKIERLIAQLCPEGVPKVRLGQVTQESTDRNIGAEIQRVRSVTSTAGLVDTETFWENSRTSSDTSSYKILRYGTFAYNPSRINIGSIAWSQEQAPVVVSPMYVVFELNREFIDPEFLMHFFKSSIGKQQIEGLTESGARFRLPYDNLSKIKIQLPPISVQEEIVSILSKFTELEAELQAELEARAKQYEFFRSSLIESRSLEVGKKIGSVEHQKLGDNSPPLVPLGELVRIRNGKDYKHLSSGEIPVYGSGGIMTHVAESAYEKPSVLIPRKGSLGNLFFVDKPFWTVDTIFWTEIGDRIEPKFLYYFLKTQRLEELNLAGGVPSLTQTTLNALMIPVPQLDIQREVVALLDAFSSMISNIETGLPTEITARRQQYEYYRNKLLTFKELKAS
jgi:type I restriction enzyme S subunit